MVSFIRGLKTTVNKYHDEHAEVFRGTMGKNERGKKLFIPSKPITPAVGGWSKLETGGKLKSPLPIWCHAKLQFIGDCLRKSGALSETGAAFSRTKDGANWTVGEAHRLHDPIVQ